MICPHCHSTMHLVESSRTEKSQVFFYRCSVCVAEHVSCRLLQKADTVHPFIQISAGLEHSSTKYFQTLS